MCSWPTWGQLWLFYPEIDSLRVCEENPFLKSSLNKKDGTNHFSSWACSCKEKNQEFDHQKNGECKIQSLVEPIYLLFTDVCCTETSRDISTHGYSCYKLKFGQLELLLYLIFSVFPIIRVSIYCYFFTSIDQESKCGCEIREDKCYFPAVGHSS